MSGQVPVILQTEIAECGLACVAMVSEFHGKKTGLESLRKIADPGTRGSTMKDLVEVADALGFSVKSLKVGLRQIDKLKLPAIIHWNLVHYVVLVGREGSDFIVHDPALGRRDISEMDFSRSFTGLAQELTPRPDFARTDHSKPVSLNWFLPRMQFSGLLATIFALAFAMQMLVTTVPLAGQLLLDHAVSSKNQMVLAASILAGGVGMLLYCLLMWSRSRLTMYLNASLDMGGTQKLIGKMLSMPYEFFARRDIGSLLTRFSNLIELRRLLTQGLAESAMDALLAGLMLAALLVYLPSVAVTAVLGTSTYIIVRTIRRPRERERVGEMFHAAGGEHASLIETISKIETVKANALEGMRERFWISRFVTFQNSVIRKTGSDLVNSIALLCTLGLAYCIATWFIADAVIAGRMSIGEGFTVFALMALLVTKSSAFADRLFELLVAKVHLDNLADVVHGDSEPVQTFGSARDTLQPLALEFRDVGFRYSDKEPFVFRHVSFEVEAGSCAALTGPSGCGKSTMLSLVLGLRTATEGQVLIGGVSIEKWDLTQLRRRIGSLLQSDRLFIGSVHENVTLFDVDAPEIEFDEAIRVCVLESVIARMPMGRHTLIGDTPSLSGGERQRLLLARAAYKNPALLVLDEATSHLDEATEKQVNVGIERSGATRIMAAHRSQTVALADMEIVLGPSLQGWSTVVETRRRTKPFQREAHVMPIGMAANT